MRRSRDRISGAARGSRSALGRSTRARASPPAPAVGRPAASSGAFDDTATRAAEGAMQTASGRGAPSTKPPAGPSSSSPSREAAIERDARAERREARARRHRARTTTLPLLLLAWIVWRVTPSPSSSSSSSSLASSSSSSSSSPSSSPLEGDDAPRYLVVVDAGSSGSRAHVFSVRDAVDLRRASKRMPRVKAEGVMRVVPGLSSFADDPASAGASLRPLFDFARTLVPEDARADTPLMLLATGGVRELSTKNPRASRRVLASCVDALRAQSSFQFSPRYAYVLPGSKEGLYAWVAANYAGGTLGEVTSKHLGVLELGGASLQARSIFTLVPIRPRPRGERRSLRTFPGVSLRPRLAFNPRHRRLSTPSDAFQLTPTTTLAAGDVRGGAGGGRAERARGESDDRGDDAQGVHAQRAGVGAGERDGGARDGDAGCWGAEEGGSHSCAVARSIRIRSIRRRRRGGSVRAAREERRRRRELHRVQGGRASTAGRARRVSARVVRRGTTPAAVSADASRAVHRDGKFSSHRALLGAPGEGVRRGRRERGRGDLRRGLGHARADAIVR